VVRGLRDEHLYHSIADLLAHRFAKLFSKRIDVRSAKSSGNATGEVIHRNAQGVDDVGLGIMDQFGQPTNLFLGALDFGFKRFLGRLLTSRAPEKAAQ
jgi:hypothetical protein